MCGICGWYNRTGRIKKDVLVKMNQSARHRGPDDEGYALINDHGIVSMLGNESIELPLPHIDEENRFGYYLGLGHRRLSILDLSEKGHQPMLTDDGLLCITFNGEIYNYLELRQQLSTKGYSFSSGSDTEVLLACYREWGIECVSHLNGMWGFAIWDHNKKKLFCSRDRLGAKPFHYYIDEDSFIFSSEIKQLIQNPEVPRVMNEDLLITQLFMTISDFSEDTLIRDIKSLQGGYNIVLDLSNPDKSVKECFSVFSYWDIDTDMPKSDKYIKEAFSAHENAVRIRTRSDAPIGILLSGGLDSSSLVAEVAEYYKELGKDTKEINTFTSCYENFAEGDERMFAKEVNRYCGTTENLIYPDEKDTFELLKQAVWHMEGIVLFRSLGSFMLLKEIGKTDIKVLINGQGSDETMFGYERYYAWYLMDCLRKEGLIKFIREFASGIRNSKLSALDMLQYYMYFNCVGIRKARCKKRISRYVTKNTVDRFSKNKNMDKYLKYPTLSSMQYGELRHAQLPHILRMDDREYMAFSLESRVPFIDYRYIEAAVRIPEKDKIKDGYTKYPLRKHIEGRLPDDVVWRKNKMGWPSPADRWMERLDKEKVEELFIEARSRKYFDIDAVRTAWRNDPHSFIIEKFLSVEIFMRIFDVDAA